MAVFEGQTRSLTPSYQNIQEALNQRANLELKRPQTEDIFTPIVARLDQEFTKQRDFEKKLAGEGRQLFTPDMAKQMSDQTGLPVEAYKGAVGRYYSPEEFQTIHDNALSQAAEPELKKSLSTKEKAVLDIGGKDAKRQLAEQTFPTASNKPPAHVVVSDPTSSTGYRYGLINSDGTTSLTQLEAPKPAAGSGEKTKTLPTAERNRLETLQTLRGQLQNINDSFDETAVGMVAGRTATAKTKVEGLSNKRQSTFIKATTSLRNEIIRARSGGAVTPSEADRLIQELPDINSSETDFRAKFQNTQAAFNEIMATRVASLDEVGYQGLDSYKAKLQPVEYTMDMSREDRDKRYDSIFNKKTTKSAAPAAGDGMAKEVTDEEASNYLRGKGKLVSPETIKAVKGFLSGNRNKK